MIATHSHRGLRRILVLSVMVHGVGLGVLALTATGRAAVVPRAVEVKLTRLGKKRPKDYLPRKESAPPPPKASVPKPVDQTVSKPAPRKKTPSPTVKDPPSRVDRLSGALDRLKKLDAPEGDESGSRFGNTSELVQATERAKFVAELKACLQENFVLEGLSTLEVANRVAHVNLSVSASGHVRYLGMKKSTGSERVDRQIINAASRCQKVSAAPKSIGSSWSRGVLVVFRPTG